VTRLVIDTGPLVAFLNRRDRHHPWAREVLAGVDPPLYSCEAVISEACFLVRALDRGPDAVLALVERGLVDTSFSVAAEVGPLRTLMAKYASVPMSLADACVVRMTELEHASTVLTMDSDFNVYRRNRRQMIPVLMPG